MKQSSSSNRASAATRGRKKTNTSASSRSGATGQSRSGTSSGSRAGNTGRTSSSSQTNSGRTSSSTTSTNRNSASTMRGNNNSSTSKRSRTSSSSSHENNFQGESHLEKFFLDQLKDIYYAENKILQSLPKMAEATTTGELKEAFEDHLHQTQRHVKRLEKAFESIGQRAEGKKCEAIEGIAREVDEIIEETEEGTLTRDAALIIAAQKVEHYEIATYGGLVQLAITMDLHDAADLLDKTLVEEEDTDARLTEIAENEINLRAEHEGSEGSWNADEEESEGEEGNENEEEEDSPSV